MRTFDYERAWHEAVKPAYESLPQNIRDLLARTARVSADLHQLSDCSMPWPDVDNDPVNSDVSGVQGFREAFDKTPAEYLSLAAQVIYGAGHWYPGASAEGYNIPGREHGAHWKFAHYADQSLRARLGLPARGSGGRERGFGVAVHEGAIRVTFASRDAWFWEEAAPATERGLNVARSLITRLTTARDSAKASDGLNAREAAEAAVYSAMETFRKAPTDLTAWPENWRPFVDQRFMCDEDDIKARHAKPAPTRAALRAELDKRTDQKIAELQRERDGIGWLIDQGLAVDNWIFYPHTNTFTAGWRQPVSAGEVSRILDIISEFPYTYAIKCADGRTLEGNQG